VTIDEFQEQIKFRIKMEKYFRIGNAEKLNVGGLSIRQISGLINLSKMIKKRKRNGTWTSKDIAMPTSSK
jgi:D-hexose-6-phosphate mutarotase